MDDRKVDEGARFRVMPAGASDDVSETALGGGGGHVLTCVWTTEAVNAEWVCAAMNAADRREGEARFLVEDSETGERKSLAYADLPPSPVPPDDSVELLDTPEKLKKEATNYDDR